MKQNNKGNQEVVLRPGGFDVKESGKIVAEVSWVDVREIFAFKRDMFTYDLICLGFRIDDEGNYWEVNEDFVGYDKLRTEFAERFAGICADWFEVVAFPAFATNRTTIWGKTLQKK